MLMASSPGSPRLDALAVMPSLVEVAGVVANVRMNRVIADCAD